MNNLVSEVTSLNQHGLITQKRAETFDLLGQLILNQTEPIIVCGAEGIGKTTLLNTFKQEKENNWVVCLLQGLETLDFEQIQTQLVLASHQHYPELAHQDLQSILSFCESQQQKVVLIIDDATNLPVGLLTTLTEYASYNQVLRIIFAFSREQLYLKSITDRVVDECYFMEIPALTKPQIADFLQDTAIFPKIESNIQVINDKFLSRLYQQTDGIPGKIIEKLPLLIELEQKKSFSLFKGILVMCTVFLSAGLFYLYNASHENNQPKTLPVQSGLHPTQQKTVKSVLKQDVIEKEKYTNNVVNESDAFKKPANLTQTAALKLNNQAIQPPNMDEQWVLQQAAEKYTLQLIAVSKRQSLLEIVKKHSNLHTALKIFPINNKNQEKYLLLYGSFADTKTAYTTVSSLPAEFKHAFPRQFATLQNDIENQTLPLLKQQPLKQ